MTSTLACVSASVSDSRTFQLALWTLVALDYAVEIYEGFHYSVDMWLGCLLVCLVWRVLAPVEGRRSEGGSKASSPGTRSAGGGGSSGVFLQDVTLRDVVVYSIPAVVAYLQANLLPQAWANPVIVLYVAAVTVLYAGFAARASDYATQQAYQHYAQNMMLCMCYLAFAVYL